MIKNPHDRILKRKPKEQYLSTVPKSCSIKFMVGPTIHVRGRVHIYDTLRVFNNFLIRITKKVKLIDWLLV